MKVNTISYTIIGSPVGKLVIGCSDLGCCLLEFEDRGGLEKVLSITRNRYQLEPTRAITAPIATVAGQLQDYFDGARSTFDFPLHIEGTAFEIKVWDRLRNIPFGETTTYGEIARQVDMPLAARAVGAANGRNTIAIVVPCHRVVQKDGGLRGYGGGLWRKQYLIDHERSKGSCHQTSLDI